MVALGDARTVVAYERLALATRVRKWEPLRGLAAADVAERGASEALFFELSGVGGQARSVHTPLRKYLTI